MGITCVTAFSADSQKLLDIIEKPLFEGPPFTPNTFDKILLDTTCSNTGQRPMLTITDVSESVIKSYSAVQKKFLQNVSKIFTPAGLQWKKILFKNIYNFIGGGTVETKWYSCIYYVFDIMRRKRMHDSVGFENLRVYGIDSR